MTHPLDHPDGQRGSLTVLFSGLMLMVLMVLALGWDTANWLLGHRALGNLADGAAVAAAGELDAAALRASGGDDVVLDVERARETVAAYLTGPDGAAARSGLHGLAAEVAAGTDPRGRVQVTVRVRAPVDAIFLPLLEIVPPEMQVEATATVVRVAAR